MHSALVVGGDGLIGCALGKQLIASGWNVVSTSRRMVRQNGWLHFDLLKGVDSLRANLHMNIQVVFICAAITGFAPCSNDPSGSHFINVTRTNELARYFLEQGVRVVYLSSNAVFDGLKADVHELTAPTPVTEYGRQKSLCEAALLNANSELPGSCAVVRLTKVVCTTLPLYSGWLRNLSSTTQVKAAIDLFICPVTVGFVVSSLQCIGSGEAAGIFHLSGERDITYFDLAYAMAEVLGNRVSVQKDLLLHRQVYEPSVVHSALSMSLTTSIWGIKPQALEVVINELTDQR